MMTVYFSLCLHELLSSYIAMPIGSRYGNRCITDYPHTDISYKTLPSEHYGHATFWKEVLI